jgi:hypothetical protein
MATGTLLTKWKIGFKDSGVQGKKTGMVECWENCCEFRVTGCGLKTFGNDGKGSQEGRKRKTGIMECWNSGKTVTSFGLRVSGWQRLASILRPAL